MSRVLNLARLNAAPRSNRVNYFLRLKILRAGLADRTLRGMSASELGRVSERSMEDASRVKQYEHSLISHPIDSYSSPSHPSDAVLGFGVPRPDGRLRYAPLLVRSVIWRALPVFTASLGSFLCLS